MIVLYTSPGCASCRKAKQWLKDRQIKYVEKNIFTALLADNEIKYLLTRTENGVDDLISKRSKLIKEENIDVEEMTVDEAIAFIRNNPTILKRPIMLNEKNFMVGYDEDEIEVFDDESVNTYFKNLKCQKECPNFDTCGSLASE